MAWEVQAAAAMTGGLVALALCFSLGQASSEPTLSPPPPPPEVDTATELPRSKEEAREVAQGEQPAAQAEPEEGRPSLAGDSPGYRAARLLVGPLVAGVGAYGAGLLSGVGIVAATCGGRSCGLGGVLLTAFFATVVGIGSALALMPVIGLGFARAMGGRGKVGWMYLGMAGGAVAGVLLIMVASPSKNPGVSTAGTVCGMALPAVGAMVGHELSHGAQARTEEGGPSVSVMPMVAPTREGGAVAGLTAVF